MLLRALIAAKDEAVRKKMSRSLTDRDILATEATNRRELQQYVSRGPYDLVLLEEGFVTTGSGLIDSVRSMPESPEVIVLSAREDPIKRAAFLAAGCLAVIYEGLADKPLGEALAALAARKRVAAAADLRRVPDEQYRLADYASKSKAMRRFLEMARKVAARDSTLLMLGETGVGKGLLARSIHNEGKRAEFPFVSVNCGALTETLLESELFGHEKGAFTGAVRARRGYFELAHRGTIFLDEITEVPLHLQVKLLKVLEDRRVQPLGSERDIQVDVRIIAASNRNLGAEVAEKRFRRDLYYRLNVVALELPPLRDRREDISDIAQSYAEHFAAGIGTQSIRLEQDAMQALLDYPWPGNVRELINVIERAVLLCSGDTIRLSDLADEIGAKSMTAAGYGKAASVTPTGSAWLEMPWVDARRTVLTAIERQYLEYHLKEVQGRVGEAATRAGMDPRSLYQKMRSYGLRKEDFHERQPAGARARTVHRRKPS